MVIPLKHLNFLFVSIFVVDGGCGDVVVVAAVVVVVVVVLLFISLLSLSWTNLRSRK